MVFLEVKDINNSFVTSRVLTLQLIQKNTNPQTCRNSGWVWSNGMRRRLFSHHDGKSRAAPWGLGPSQGLRSKD